jgi:exodeoxyribonuclease X
MTSLFRVIDVESTGIPEPNDPHAIVEIGWCDVQQRLGRWAPDRAWQATLVNPGRPIPAEASAVHHIVDSDVQASPTPPQAIRRALGGAPDDVVLAAHHADFERAFINGAMPWICTWKAALRLWPDAPAHSNQVLRYHLALAMDRTVAMPAHRAGPDAYATAWLLAAILNAGADIAELIRWSDGPALLPRVPFGKHRGAKWEDVPTDYLRWVAEKSELDRDAKANALHHLKKRAAA